jgi:hypothetical protein
MKKILSVLIIVWSFFSASLFGQSVAWNFNTSIPAADYALNFTNQQSVRTVNLVNATVSDITLSNAVGVGGNTYHRSSNWGPAFTSTDYIEFSVTATPGNYFPNNLITLNITYGVLNPAIGNLRVLYAWDNNSFTQTGSDILNYANNTISPLTPFTIPAPGNTTSTKITVRILCWINLINGRQRNLIFGDFQLSGNSPLPVTFNGLNHVVSGNNVKLNWSTSMEENNSGFKIERKLFNTENWENVAFVRGKGNSNTVVNYTYTDKNLQTGKYKYRLKQIDYNGNFEYFNLNGIVEVGNPGKYSLSQNYPNPFNPFTKINYEIPSDGNVAIKIYDISGKEVLTLLNGHRQAGYHTAVFDGGKLTSGVYFYKLEAKDFSKVMRMILIK